MLQKYDGQSDFNIINLKTLIKQLNTDYQTKVAFSPKRLNILQNFGSQHYVC